MFEELLMGIFAIAAVIVALLALVAIVAVGGFLGMSAGALLAGIAAALPEWRPPRPRR